MTPEERVEITTDRSDPGLRRIVPGGQQSKYLVLSEDERAKGFVRPVCQSYKHLRCGRVTTMGLAIAETYARDPTFYNGTFCVHCAAHFPLRSVDGEPAFVWTDDGSVVGEPT